MLFIVAPERCYLPPKLHGQGRTWGLSVNLYALRSARNHGIGDLTDLKNVVEWVGGKLGGGFVAVNPLHAISNQMPYGISPYSPVSRLYTNLIYLDIEGVEDVRRSSRVRSIMEGSGYRNEMKRLKESDLIDYEGVFRLKRKVLRAAFQFYLEEHHERKTHRSRRFREFMRTEGALLDTYATYMALDEHFREVGLFYWKGWPGGYQSPDSDEVQDFRDRQSEKILFHKYLQWIVHEQLQDVITKAAELGMVIGIYRDLAVGSTSGGSDVWSSQRVFATGMDVGAPPDDFSPMGQKWGFPPLIPERMREEGYKSFIQLIRKNLSCGGALRIDHALGLFRLFWIPEGMHPEEGGYVRYPHEDLLRIIALESVRNRAVVIAEDLGTIGDEVRETLKRFGMLSFRLFYFEKDYETDEFLPPRAYPELAIVSTTTHDLPTLSGFWAGRDISVKRDLGRYPDDEAFQRDLKKRDHDRKEVLRALGRAHLLSWEGSTNVQGCREMTDELRLSIYRYLGLTPSKLLIVNLDDITSIVDQQNLPGTIDEYPNWRQKIPFDLESMMKMKIFSALRGIRK
jgi:4-alpha-glucanotransferase